MKIGIMLRHFNQHGGGIKVVSDNLLQEMLRQNVKHKFVLFYRDSRLIGTYGSNPNVREISIKAPSILLWDQIAVRYQAEKEKLDLIFNPKSSIPLSSKCKTIYVCHGMQWARLPLRKPWTDHISHRFLIPLYAKYADAIIANSETTRQDLIKYFGIEEHRVHTVYLGVDEKFKKPLLPVETEKIRHLYNLPKRFLLFVGQIFPQKNFGRLIKAYAKVGPENGIHLVVAGEHRYYCEHELALIDKLGISEWVVQVGWIDHQTLPYLYALAEALVFPSLHESFGLPALEAMASGCPVITSNRYGLKEVVDKSGILVDPENVDSIADGIRKVINDSQLRQNLVNLGKKRSHHFSWEKCARQTLDVIEAIQ